MDTINPLQSFGLERLQRDTKLTPSNPSISIYWLSFIGKRAVEVKNHRSQQGLMFTLSTQKPKGNPNQLECLIVKSGTLNITIGNQYFNFHKNQILCFDTDTPRILEPSPGLELVILTFDPSFFLNWPFTFEIPKHDSIPYPASFYNSLFAYVEGHHSFTYFTISDALQQNLFAKLLDDLSTQLTNQNAGFSYTVYNGIYKMFELFDHYLVEDSYYVFDRAQDLTLTHEVMRYLHNNPYKMNTTDIAKQFHVNPSYLQSSFKKYMGKTIHVYNQEVYLNYALELLENPKLTINEIIQLLNFVNKTQFYRVFKDCYGCTPFEYRNQKK